MEGWKCEVEVIDRKGCVGEKWEVGGGRVQREESGDRGEEESRRDKLNERRAARKRQVNTSQGNRQRRRQAGLEEKLGG